MDTYDYIRTRHAERVARSLSVYAPPRGKRGRDCPLERLVKWIAARRRARLDPAALAR